MARYLLMIGGADVDKRSGNPEIRPQLIERFMDWIREMQEREQFVESHKLYDQTGRRLTVRGGEVIDGPFIESKDAVGGLIVVEAASLDDATDIARACPVFELQNGYVEVRSIEASRLPASV